MQIVFAAIIVSIFVWTSAFAQGVPAPERPAVTAAKLAESPRLDGNVLDDPAWHTVTPVEGFWQTAPDAGRPVSERTEVRIAYTRDTLYVGVVCFDRSANGMIVSDARRDSSMSDTDSFRMVFDTYHDGQNGFVFGTTPAGVQYDGQVTQEGQSTTPGPRRRRGRWGPRRRSAAGRIRRRVQSELGWIVGGGDGRQ